MTAGSGDVIYRLPPYKLGPQILMAADVEDIIDWGLKSHNIPGRWLSTKGKGILVGVADTGRPHHVDLEQNIFASRNFTEAPSDEDVEGHSTHVCGIIGAVDNNRGIIGVAPEVKLATAKVLHHGAGTNGQIAAGIRWLADIGCHIINLSLGGAYSEDVKKACDYACKKGAILICAAGNSGKMGNANTMLWPARLSNTVAVGSYNQNGELSDYSSRGQEIHAAFPGEDVLSCWPGNTYRRISGTSMAAPFCSAVTALLLAYQNQTGNKVIKNGYDLIYYLQKFSLDKGPEGRDPGWRWGIVDVEKLLGVVRPQSSKLQVVEESKMGCCKHVSDANENPMRAVSVVARNVDKQDFRESLEVMLEDAQSRRDIREIIALRRTLNRRRLFERAYERAMLEFNQKLAVLAASSGVAVSDIGDGQLFKFFLDWLQNGGWEIILEFIKLFL